MMKKDISANYLYHTCLIFCIKILPDVLHNMSLQFCYHGNIPVSRPPDINGFAGHLWCPILIFANGASSTRSSKHINMLGRVRGLVKVFFELKITKILKSGYSHRCVACRTISLPSFNGLCFKLTEIALFTYLM